jgi:hypothetical protein
MIALNLWPSVSEVLIRAKRELRACPNAPRWRSAGLLAPLGDEA